MIIEKLKIILIVFIFVVLFPFQVSATSIPNRVAIPVPVPPGATVKGQWSVSTNPGEIISQSAIRWAIGKFNSYRSPTASFSSSLRTANGWYQGQFCIPSNWQGKTETNFIQMGAWALINGWKNIYQPSATIVPQAVYDNVGAENSVTQVNGRPYEARYAGGSRNWRYSGGWDKTTSHYINSAFSQTVIKSQREGIEKYQILNWNVFKAQYKINFYFAEFSSTGPNQRVFDILVNGQPINIIVNDSQTRSSTNLDVYALSGRYKQLKVSFFTQSKADSNIEITFQPKTWKKPILNAADIIALQPLGKSCDNQSLPTPIPTVPTPTITPSNAPTPNPSPTIPPMPNSCPLNVSQKDGFITNSINNQWKYYSVFKPSVSGFLKAIEVKVGNWGGANRKVTCKITNNFGENLSNNASSDSFRKSDGQVWRKITFNSPVLVYPNQNYRLYCQGPDSWNSIYWLKNYSSYTYKTYICPNSNPLPPSLTPTPLPTISLTPTPTVSPQEKNTLVVYVYQETDANLIRQSWREPLVNNQEADVFYRKKNSSQWIWAGNFTNQCNQPLTIKNLVNDVYELQIRAKNRQIQKINGSSQPSAIDANCKFSSVIKRNACNAWDCNHRFTTPITLNGNERKTIFFSLK